MIRFALQSALLVSSAHIGTPTLAPAPTIAPGSFVLVGGQDSFPGQPAQAAKPAVLYPNGSVQYPAVPAFPALPSQPAVAAYALFNTPLATYRIPASQLAVLATQAVPSGPLSLTLIVGTGSTAQAFQFSLGATGTKMIIQSARQPIAAVNGNPVRPKTGS